MEFDNEHEISPFCDCDECQEILRTPNELVWEREDPKRYAEFLRGEKIRRNLVNCGYIPIYVKGSCYIAVGTGNSYYEEV